MPRSRFAFCDNDGPIAMAHRGFSRDGLENSMAAFAAAVDLGLRYLETDVHATRDGVLLAFHDDKLDRVTDRAGIIAELPWSVVREARIGGVEPIPRLEDVLGAWPDVKVNIDVKASPAIAPLVDVIRRTAAVDRVCVASFSGARRAAVRRQLGPRVATSVGPARVAVWRLGGSLPGPAGGAAARLAVRGAAALQVPERAGPLRVVTSASVARAHAAGVQVHVWTVDDPADMHRLLDLGVDGLITDRADLLRDVLVARGHWPA
ncbi:MAG: glycerophosphodiester phosphodiesterase [Actinomycetales bacterium]